MQYTITVNGHPQRVEAQPETPVLWVLREQLRLTGTKYGCGVAQCGACTILLEGRRTFACQLPIAAANAKAIVTIEGLADNGDHPLQKAWVEEQVPQCGYCQSGMIMSAADLLSRNSNPSGEDIASWMQNICRCGTYPRVLRAIQRAAREMRS